MADVIANAMAGWGDHMKTKYICFLIFFLSFQAMAKGLPLELSETGLFSTQEAPILYNPQFPLWSDGAKKRRWIFLPQDKKITISKNDTWLFPVGTKLWKEFSLPVEGTQTWKKVETRYIEKTEKGWIFAVYLWDKENKKAKLAPLKGIPNYWPLAGGKKYSIPDRAACLNCHNALQDRVLGFNALQLSSARDPKISGPTVKTLIENNLIDLKEDRPPTMAYDPQLPQESKKAFDYIQANCTYCHNPKGAAHFTGLHLQADSLGQDDVLALRPYYANTVGVPTLLFNIPQVPGGVSYQIYPGSLEKSAFYFRMKQNGPLRMPPAWANAGIDQHGLEVIKDYISKLRP